MERLEIAIERPAAYDDKVHGPNSLPNASPLSVVTKCDGGGGQLKGLAVVSFYVQLPEGAVVTAQCTTTVKLLIGLGRVLQGAYHDDGSPRIAVG